MTPTNAKPLPLVLRLVIAICFAALGLLQCPSTVSRPQNSPPSPLSSPHEERGGFRFVSCDGSSSYFTAAGCKFNRGELHEGQGRYDHAQPRTHFQDGGARWSFLSDCRSTKARSHLQAHGAVWSHYRLGHQRPNASLLEAECIVRASGVVLDRTQSLGQPRICRRVRRG